MEDSKTSESDGCLPAWLPNWGADARARARVLRLPEPEASTQAAALVLQVAHGTASSNGPGPRTRGPLARSRPGTPRAAAAPGTPPRPRRFKFPVPAESGNGGFPIPDSRPIGKLNDRESGIGKPPPLGNGKTLNGGSDSRFPSVHVSTVDPCCAVDVPRLASKLGSDSTS